jgi:hypothetical protein
MEGSTAMATTPLPLFVILSGAKNNKAGCESGG